MKYFSLLKFGCVVGLTAANLTAHEQSHQIYNFKLQPRDILETVDDASSPRLIRRTPMRGNQANQNRQPPPRHLQTVRSSGSRGSSNGSPPATPGPRGSSQMGRPQPSSLGQNAMPDSTRGPSEGNNSRPPSRNDGRNQSRLSANTDYPPGLQRNQNLHRQRLAGSASTPIAPVHSNRRIMDNTAGPPSTAHSRAHAVAHSQGARGHYVTSVGQPGQMNLAQNRRPIPSGRPWSAVPAQVYNHVSAAAGVLVPHGPPNTRSGVSASGSHGAITMVNVPHGSQAEITSLRNGSPPRVHRIQAGNEPTIFDQRSPNGRMTRHHTSLIGPGSIVSQGINVPTPVDGTMGPDYQRLQEIRHSRSSLNQVTTGYSAPAA